MPRASARAATRIMLVRMAPGASGFLPSACMAAAPMRPMPIPGPRRPRPMASPAASIFIVSGSICFFPPFLSEALLLPARQNTADNTRRNYDGYQHRRSYQGHHQEICKLHCLSFLVVSLIMEGNGYGSKDHCEPGKDEGLDEADEHLQPVERQRQEGDKEGSNQEQGLPRRHVAEETEGEAEDADEVADGLQPPHKEVYHP